MTLGADARGGSATAARSRSRAPARAGRRRDAAARRAVDRVFAEALDQLVVADGVRATPVLVGQPSSSSARRMPSASAPSVPGSGREVLVGDERRCGCGTGRRRSASRRSCGRSRSAATGAAPWTSGSSPSRRSARACSHSSGSTSGDCPFGCRRRRRRRRADGADEVRCADRGHEPVGHHAALQHALRAEVRSTAGPTRGPCRSIACAMPAARRVQRLVPGGRPELAGALRPGPDQRVQQALGRVHALEVVGHLAAEESGGDRMVGAAGELVARPSSTVTWKAQVSGQSCGQAPRTRAMPRSYLRRELGARRSALLGLAAGVVLEDHLAQPDGLGVTSTHSSVAR